MSPLIPLVGLFFGLVPGLTGCKAWSSVRFEPSPLAVAIAPDAGSGALGTALFSWDGIEAIDSGWGARFRVRVENDSEGPLRLDPGGCELIDGSLVAFGPPLVERLSGSGSQEGWEVPPHEAVVWSLTFPFPDGGDPARSDLSGLHLALALVDDKGGIRVSATFDRLERDTGYWGGSVHYGVGWYGHGHDGRVGTVSFSLARRF